ncbi:MAG TPA: MBL fold metallo-hydrolase [Gemmatimonadaceae bacterium]|nr:MBL fold metallo-hydrolase [Gemmatimonadaceae bacterium]
MSATASGPRVETLKVGRLTVHAIQAGGQKLDGGAMFGVVPKPLWERRIHADERNRIQLGMRCLLVEHERGLVLIDNGAGNKESQKFHEIYGVENGGAGGRTLLEDGFAALGVKPEDVTLMIDTHLHFDHAGGNTYVDGGGIVRPTFPNARYVVQRGEYEWATHTNERTAASYFPHNFEPVVAAGLYDFVNGETEVWPGIRLIPTPGHTPHHQSVLLESDGARAFYPADLSPTAAHIPLPWIMGYDVEPLRTLETKRATWKRAVDEDWLLIFEHDAFVTSGRIVVDGKGYSLKT